MLILRFREAVALTHKFSAMKKIILTCALSALMLSASAQLTERRMATLVDDGVTKVFYGKDAPSQAYQEAKEGATIIVGEGEYSQLSVAGKSVKVYGVGFEDNEDSGAVSTKMSVYINSGKYFDEYGKEYYAYPENLHLEGLHMNRCYVYEDGKAGELKGLNISKCRIEGSGTYERFDICAKTVGMMVSQSKVMNVYFHNLENDALFRNCIINCVEMGTDLKSGIVIDHCIINRIYSSCIAYYTNNIVLGQNVRIPADAMAFNNIFVNKDAWNINATGEGNWFGIAVNGIFAEDGEDGTYAPGKKFTLKYPKTYIATDGTEVGINGGTTPWNPIPALPRIISSKIDNRADSDGKISVSIKVEAQNKP